MLILTFFSTLIMRKVLDQNIVPENYTVLIDTQHDIFNGSVSIKANIKEATDKIRLNAYKLNIANYQVVHKNGVYNKDSIKISEDDKVLTLDLEDEVEGEVVINISYNAKISNSMNGYYVSEYKSDNGKERLYSTHFEATSARRAVPCFDQPDMKATFDVVLTVPEGMTGLSNMDVSSEIDIVSYLKNKTSKENGSKEKALKEKTSEHGKSIENPKQKEKEEDKLNNASKNNSSENNSPTKSNSSTKNDNLNSLQIETLMESKNKNLVFFNTSPKMSTYLLAFVVGKIEKKSGSLGDVKINIYAPAGDEEDADYALEITKQCLDYYQNYFKIPYPLPKLDNIGIPNFAMGAMENWGLITYRMSSLLYGKNSSLQTKKCIAETICHELAHQWFGNLVTMKWWDDLWLNEGFATWASYKAIEQIEKEFPVTDFISSETSYGLSYDALNSTHPINVEVNDPMEIDQIFDGIIYSKGACLINMLEDYLGKDFQEGLIGYLKQHEYGNAETQDLWDSLNVGPLMNDWVRREGVPVIQVEEKDDFLLLKQKRFLFVPDYKGENFSSDNNSKDSSDSKSKDSSNDSQSTKGKDSSDASQSTKSKQNKGSSSKGKGPIHDNGQSSKGSSDTSQSSKGSSDTSQSSKGSSDTSQSSKGSKDVRQSSKRSSEDESNPKVFKSSDSVWKIPVRISFYGDGTELNELYMFEAEEMKIKKKSNLYKLNNASAGFYITHYKNENMAYLLLDKVKLGEKDKLNILNDTLNLVKASMLPVKDALNIILLYKDESNCDIIASILCELMEMKSIFYKDVPQRTRLQVKIIELVESKISKVFDNITGKGLKYNEMSLYSVVLAAAVNNDHPMAIDRLGKIYVEYKKDKASIHPNFRGSMFVSLMKRYNNGEKELFDELYDSYINDKSSDDVKNSMLLALGASNNFKFLSEKLLDDTVKTQNLMYLYASLANNIVTRDDLISFTMKNFDKIQAKFEDNSSLLGFVVERVFGIISHREMRDKVLVFLKKANTDEVSRSVMKCLEKSEIKIRFRNANLKEFE